jgi:hypothetical protein
MKHYLAYSYVMWLNGEQTNVWRTNSVIVMSEIMMVLETLIYLWFNHRWGLPARDSFTEFSRLRLDKLLLLNSIHIYYNYNESCLLFLNIHTGQF